MGRLSQPAMGREPSGAERIVAAIETSARQIASAPHDVGFAAVCARHGVKATEWEPRPSWITTTLDAWLAGVAWPSVCEVVATAAARRDTAATVWGDQIRHVEQIPANVEVGTVGTPMSSGILRVEPAPRLQPYLARGFAGSIGQYERSLREPVVYKSYQSIRELLVTGQWDLHLPEDVPDHMVERVQEATRWMWRKLRAIDGGWDGFVESAASSIIFGFSIFEVVWGADLAGRAAPAKLSFREPSTVERWLMDPWQRHLLGVSFQAGGDAPYRWALPACGERVTDQRVLLCTLGGRGNNFEGLPPTRVADVLITYKQLILSIMAAGSERFACPVLMVRQTGEAGVQANDATVSSVYEIAASLQAMDTPAIQLPPGVELVYLSASGIMPDLLPIVEYLDRAIHQVFSTQAQALGSGHGSYALAQVQDDDLLRAIPYYARTISRPINALIRRVLGSEWGIPADACPDLVWSPRVEADNTRWFADLSTFVATDAAAGGLPEAIRAEALLKLGLPPDALDSQDAAPEAIAQDVEVTDEQ